MPLLICWVRKLAAEICGGGGGLEMFKSKRMFFYTIFFLKIKILIFKF